MFTKLNLSSDELSVHSPAKVNLMLSVHGRRPDGFHELTSMVAALKFGDTLTIRIADDVKDKLVCSDAAVPLGSDNLILKAAVIFRARLGRKTCFEFNLKKRIPMGAGYGGGSGNAVAALQGMNQLLDEPFDKQTLCEMAADLGSDCPFFVEGAPAWMRGRGETIEPFDSRLAEKLSGTPVALFKPNFGVNTTWAYERLAANARESYQQEAVDVAHLENSIETGAWDTVLNNSFEAAVGKKFLAIPVLLKQLRAAGVACLMSGSGSGCFALPESGNLNLEQIKHSVQDAWGKEVFWVETSIY